MATDRKLTQGTAITALAATDKFYIEPAGGTVPWGYMTAANLHGYISAGAGTAMYPTGAFVAGGYLYFNGGTVLTDSNVLSATGTATVTNKRIQKRRVTVTQSATPTINTDNGDIFTITGLAQAITSLTTNLSGTPATDEMIIIHFTDNGTGRTITPGASFVGTAEFSLTGLTTTANKRLTTLWMWNGSAWALSGKLNGA